MKIGIDAGSLGIKDKRLKTGVYKVCLNLVTSLSKLDKKNSYFLYSFDPIDKKILTKLSNNFQNKIVRPKKGWASVWLPLKLRQDKINLFIGANQFIPSFLPSNIKKIGIIYDLGFLLFPKHYPASQKLNSITEKTVKLAGEIVTISKKSKNDIFKIYNFPSKKIHVFYPGIENFKTYKKNDKNYFLFVGSMKKSKNIPGIIRAYESFTEQNKSKLDLYIVGGDFWLDKEIKTAMSKVSPAVKSKIIFKGYLPDSRMKKIYQNAFAFISPSFYEGFGLPHAEAMSAGLPVIASDKGSLPEIVGKGGVFPNPRSIDKIAEEMTKLYKDKNLREKLSKNAKRQSEKFSWDKFGKDFYNLIKKYES